MIKRFARRTWYAYRQSHFKWRCVDNLVPTLSYHLARPRLENEERRILDELNRNGVALSDVDSLFGSRDCLREMQAETARLQEVHADWIAERRANAGDVEEEKSFLCSLLGDRPLLDPQNVFLKVALQAPLLRIANAYLGMSAALRYFNVWQSLTTQSAPQRSQLWHRDRDDHSILKVFVYLSDVDEGTGPFRYAPGTHAKGPVTAEPESYLEPNRKNPRSTDEQMAQVVPADRWVTATGPAGTIVFADTHGYHKGGLARTRERLVQTCMFVSPRAKCENWIQRDESLLVRLERQQRRALAAG